MDSNFLVLIYCLKYWQSITNRNRLRASPIKNGRPTSPSGVCLSSNHRALSNGNNSLSLVLHASGELLQSCCEQRATSGQQSQQAHVMTCDWEQEHNKIIILERNWSFTGWIELTLGAGEENKAPGLKKQSFKHPQGAEWREWYLSTVTWHAVWQLQLVVTWPINFSFKVALLLNTTSSSGWTKFRVTVQFLIVPLGCCKRVLYKTVSLEVIGFTCSFVKCDLGSCYDSSTHACVWLATVSLATMRLLTVRSPTVKRL